MSIILPKLESLIYLSGSSSVSGFRIRGSVFRIPDSGFRIPAFPYAVGRHFVSVDPKEFGERTSANWDTFRSSQLFESRRMFSK